MACLAVTYVTFLAIAHRRRPIVGCAQRPTPLVSLATAGNKTGLAPCPNRGQSATDKLWEIAIAHALVRALGAERVHRDTRPNFRALFCCHTNAPSAGRVLDS